jgi:hypothetical protein
MSNQSSTTTTTNTPKEELSVAEEFRRDEMLVAKLNSNFKSRVYEWYLKEEDEKEDEKEEYAISDDEYENTDEDGKKCKKCGCWSDYAHFADTIDGKFVLTDECRGCYVDEEWENRFKDI